MPPLPERLPLLAVFRTLLHAGRKGLSIEALAAQSDVSQLTVRECVASLCERRMAYTTFKGNRVVYCADYDTIYTSLKTLAVALDADDTKKAGR